MNGKRKIMRYRRLLFVLLAMGIFAIPAYWYYDIYGRVPTTIHLREGQTEYLNLNVPVSGTLYKKPQTIKTESGKQGQELQSVETTAIPQNSTYVSLNRPVTFTAPKADAYQMDLKLLGIVPLKRVNFEVVQEEQVLPAGTPIGIYVKTEGVMVIDTGKFKDMEGNWQQPAEFILKSGDYIEDVNGVPVTNKKEFVEEVSTSSGEEMILSLLRQDEKIKVKVRPHKNENGEYKIGIWVRDSAQGIGTLTYLDKKNQFGALGHGINDIDTANLMEVKNGSLYETCILDISPGKSGKPGEITGMIQYEEKNKLGTIHKNTSCGIFGEANHVLMEEVEQKWMPVGLKQDIQIGPAQILCSIGKETKAYTVNIVKLDYIEENSNRGIILEVTDPELLSKTGGIIQGMSGAPIIQNGKLIGAVTHVLVQDPTKGYGIFIETMMNQE